MDLTQPAQAREPHPDDDEHTEGVAYGLWLLNSPYRHGGEEGRLNAWEVLRHDTGAPTWMAKARFVQASARALENDRAEPASAEA